MKPIWMPAAFLAGLAAGVLIDRGLTHDSATIAVVAKPQDAAPSRVSTSPAGDSGIAMAPSIAVRSPAVAPSPAPGATPVARDAAPEAAAAGDDSTPVQPIDVGPAFRTQFAATKKGGFHDQTVELHAALEREPRDDSWSYPLEADIQNSLLAETTAGAFKAEHVECRTSMCEIRLSAGDEQQAKALQKWTEGMHTQAWGSQVNLNSALTISDGGHTDALMILVRPPKAAPSR